MAKAKKITVSFRVDSLSKEMLERIASHTNKSMTHEIESMIERTYKHLFGK